MLLDEKTQEQFGYIHNSLPPCSTKKFVVGCDYCGGEFITSNNPRKVAHKVIAKDSCKTCQSIKTGDANLIRLGVRSPSQLQSVKDKAAATNIDRFGAKSYLGSEDGQNRFKKTCLDKYGVENPSSLADFKQKRKRTCLEKFGKETYFS